MSNETPDPVAAMDRVLATLLTTTVGAPGAEAVVAEDVIFGSLGLPLAPLNTVAGAHLDPFSIDARIEEILDWFAERRMPFTWWVGPRDTPDDLPQRLAAHGLVEEADRVPGMAASLERLPDEAPGDGIEVTRVRDRAGWAAACSVAAEGFGIPEEFVPAMVGLATRDFDDANPQRPFLVALDGRLVGCALGVLDGDVVGVFNVATVAGARRRGVGRAVMLALMRHAADAGSRLAVLQSSTMGHGVYERLGFRDFGLYRVFAPTPRGD